MDQTTIEHVPEVRNHWWWRPGWRQGRHFYACHLSFEDHSELHSLVDRYQVALRTFPILDLIPRPWLHLTMQGIGFVDEISNDTVDKIEDALRSTLRRMSPPVVTFHRPVIVPEAIYLPALPATQIQDLRETCRAAITTAQDLVPDTRPYRPHVSIAYVNTASSTEHIAQTLDTVAADPVKITISHVSLMVFHRDHHMYEWPTAIRIPIGNNPA